MPINAEKYFMNHRDIYIYIYMKISPQYGFQIENKYQKVGSTRFILGLLKPIIKPIIK